MKNKIDIFLLLFSRYGNNNYEKFISIHNGSKQIFAITYIKNNFEDAIVGYSSSSKMFRIANSVYFSSEIYKGKARYRTKC